jgi:hypothetical protein
MTVPPIPDVDTLIELLGGTERAVTLLGISRTLLFLWESEGVPAKRWRQIVELLKLQGHKDVTLATIAHIAPKAALPPAKGRTKPDTGPEAAPTPKPRTRRPAAAPAPAAAKPPPAAPPPAAAAEPPPPGPTAAPARKRARAA